MTSLFTENPRLIYLIIGTSIMTLTTTPNELTDGLEKALKPLNKIRVPVHEISMMMSIALRFIPILLEETDKIIINIILFMAFTFLQKITYHHIHSQNPYHINS